MSDDIVCYRCGSSLAQLTLPLSRRDLCPGCSTHVHVCRMCVNFDPDVPGQCREEDAEEVHEKEQVNFCDWFAPAAGAFDPERAARDARARSDLAALFGDGEPDEAAPDEAQKAAEDLFK